MKKEDVAVVSPFTFNPELWAEIDYVGIAITQY